MLNIIRLKFKEQFRSILYYLVGLILYTWMLAAMFPTMEKINLDAYPEEFLKFFGGESISSMSKIEGFLSMEFLSLFFILIISFYIGSSAGSIIAGSVEKKMMDFQLSQPISRTKILLAESFVGLSYSAILAIITSISIYAFCLIYSIKISEMGIVAFTITAIMLLWSFYGIALFFSSFLRSKIVVAGLTVSTVMVFYVLTAMTNIFDKISKLEKLSPFYTYNPQKLLESGNINPTHLLILAGILIVGLISSLVIFNKKDI